MTGNSNPYTNRRSVLKTAGGVVTLIGLAGCSDGGRDGGDGGGERTPRPTPTAEFTDDSEGGDGDDAGTSTTEATLEKIADEIVAEIHWLSDTGESLTENIKQKRLLVLDQIKNIYNNKASVSGSAVDELESLGSQHQELMQSFLEHYSLSPDWEEGESIRQEHIGNIRQAVKLNDEEELTDWLNKYVSEGLVLKLTDYWNLSNGIMKSDEDRSEPISLAKNRFKYWGTDDLASGAEHNLYRLIQPGQGVRKFTDLTGIYFDGETLLDRTNYEKDEKTEQYIKEYFQGLPSIGGDRYYFRFGGPDYDASSRNFPRSPFTNALIQYDSAETAVQAYDSLLSEAITEGTLEQIGYENTKVAWKNDKNPTYATAINFGKYVGVFFGHPDRELVWNNREDYIDESFFVTAIAK
jgi:hypothetical protein